jgi:Uma2 family endonuclease
MVTQPHALITAEQFYQLPQEEGREFELLDGEVIEMPSPTYEHGRIVMKLGALLYPGLRGRGEQVDNTDFSDARATTLRPDLAVLLGEKPSLIDPWKLPVTTAPDIVVEVISPSESAFRVERRINAYLRFGVREVWIIYPQDQHIYQHTEAGVQRLRSGNTLETPLLPGWSIAVDQIFER